MIPTVSSLEAPIEGPKYIRLVSDAHLEFSVGRPDNIRKLFSVITEILPILPTDRETVLVLAGDISCFHTQLEDMIKECSFRFHSVILVAGNHEHYGNDLRDWDKLAEKIESEEMNHAGNVYVSRVSSTQSIEMPGVRFIIDTLWCDPFDGGKAIPSQVFSDFLYIKDSASNTQLLAAEMRDMFEGAKKNIFTAVEKPFSGTTVVVTHHAPLWAFTDPKYGQDSLSHMFIGDCHKEFVANNSPLALWLFGHTHYAIDQTILNTRFVNNPVGYPNQNPVRPYEPTLLITL